DPRFEVAVSAFDGAVLVRDAAVVAGRHHTEMDDERREAPGQVFGIRQSQITEGGREAVAAMLSRNAAEQAQRILQPAGQGRVALATQHDLSMLEAGKGEREVVEPMFQRLATDDDAKAIPVGEIGQAHAARLLDLREDDLEVGTVESFP